MTTLRFKARGGHRVPVPGTGIPGQFPRYVGLEYDHDKGDYVAKPFECDADSQAGMRLAKLATRDGSIEPADAATARACGIAFSQPSKKGDA